MPVKRLIRTNGRTGPFWRLTIGQGPGSLTFFSRISAADVVARYMAHCRQTRLDTYFADSAEALQHG